MANEQAATAVQVESIIFPPSLKPPGSSNTFLLGGADRPGDVSIALPYLKEDVFHEVGVRGLDIQGKFVKFSGIGIYLEEDKAISSLALKWNGKNADELRDSDDFFRDIVTGKQFSEKVAENCVRDWKSLGIYTQDDAKDIDKFLEIFKDRNFPPGSSILFTVSPGEAGSLSISFSEDDIVWPEAANAVLENGKLGQAIIYSQIGKNGVSPAAKQSLASRLSDLMNHFDHKTNGNGSKFKVCVI